MSQKSGTETSTVSHYYGMCACVCGCVLAWAVFPSFIGILSLMP